MLEEFKKLNLAAGDARSFFAEPWAFLSAKLEAEVCPPQGGKGADSAAFTHRLRQMWGRWLDEFVATSICRSSSSIISLALGNSWELGDAATRGTVLA